jgi:hypothetical protein
LTLRSFTRAVLLTVFAVEVASLTAMVQLLRGEPVWWLWVLMTLLVAALATCSYKVKLPE